MSLQQYFGLFRGFLVLVGLGLFASGLNTAASMPSGPPQSDGFIEGLAYLYAILIGVLGLVFVQIGYAFPAGSGRFRVGPLANRTTAIRGGATVLVYVLMAFLLVYGVPSLVPSVTGSSPYVTALFVLVIAGGLGTLLTGLLTLGNLIRRLTTGT